MGKIGIVADDLTGATTVGVLLAKSGISTAAFFDERSLEERTDYQAMVLSSDSRHLKKEEAQKRVKLAVRSLKNHGAIYFSKRIDTTMRGGIGFEVDAMLEELDSDTIAIMVPTMPQSNRILVGGYSLIDGVALSKTPVANDVRTPVTETHVPSLMAQQTKQKIGTIPLGDVLLGKEQLKQTLIEKRENKARVIIIDAVTLEDVETIAEAVTELEWNVLAIDPGPFSERLAILKDYGSDNEQIIDNYTIEQEIKGTVLAVAGSASPITKTQLKALSLESGTYQISVDAELLIDKKNQAFLEIHQSTNKAIAALESQTSRVILLESALNGNVLNLQEKEAYYRLQPGDAARNINTGLGEIVKNLLNNGIGDIKGIYLTGGDTMVSVLRLLGAKGIELIDYVIPQADLGRIIGGKYDGLIVVGKGGLTGKENTAISIIRRIFEESLKSSAKTTLNH
ncbi:four-carbon acid sugar kinase family protein [Priestia filamentosa]|uniref:four-carbon acid sugar kinase family protein n=1 Tax=Priestia filamentosa TaxID=1402861 RepID=UPI001C1DE6EA|nr:four-carbon acid sugar kinase family protein [Priestia filamentosa]